MELKTPDLPELGVLLRHVPQVVIASLTRKPKQVIIPDPSSFMAAVALFDISGVSMLGSNLSDLEKDQIKCLSLTTMQYNETSKLGEEVIDAAKHKFHGYNKVSTEHSAISHQASSSRTSSGRRRSSATYSSSLAAPMIPADTLTTTLNKSFQPIIDVILRHSGDIIKFTGDTMIVLWETEISLQTKTPAGILAYRAARCAVEALRALRSVSSSGNKLRMKIGIGTSEVTPHHVGGVRDRWEFYISGSANRQMSLALQHAPKGNVTLSLEAYGALAYSMATKELRNIEMSANTVENGIHIITKLSHSPLAQASRCFVKPNLEVTPLLRGYVPGPIVSCLQKGLALTSSAREVTVILIKLSGIMEMSDDLQQSEEIHRLLCIIQSSVYKLQGTLKQFMFDGNSAVVTVVMGLAPFYHENNAVRGVKFACSMLNQGIQASIGVTTGTVFCGPVGGKARTMYTVAGTVVDLAKGLTLAAKLGEILCDVRTYEEAKGSINFSAAHQITVGSTADPLVIYCVLCEKVVADTDAQHRSVSPPYGYDHILNMMPVLGDVDAANKSDRSNIISDLKHKKRLLVVSGEAGTGKTMLVQYLKNQNSHCYADTGNPDTAALRLRAWSGIVRGMIAQSIPATQPCVPEAVRLNSETCNEDSILAVEEACQSRVNSRSSSESVMAEIEQFPERNCQDLSAVEERVPLLEFLESEGYTSNAMLPILNDLLPHDELFETGAIFTFQQGEERAKVLEEIIVSMLTVLSKNKQILLLFDNAHFMHEDSWLLIQRVLDELPNVCALMTIRSKCRIECPAIYGNARSMENTSQVELQRFSNAATSQFLGRKYQITTINSQLVDFVYGRTDGNPAAIVNLVDFMIEENFISLDRKRGTVKILSELEDLDMGIPQHTRAHVMTCVDNLEGLAQIAIKVISVNPGSVQEKLLISILQVFLNSQHDGSTNDMADIQVKFGSSFVGQVRNGLAACSREGILSVDALEKRYTFHSEEMRLVVYDVMIPSQRQLIHMLYCQWFTELCNANPGSESEAKLKLDADGSFNTEISHHRYLSRIAYHLLGARRVRSSLDTYQQAAEKAIETNDLYLASEYLTSSLRILDEQALYSKLFSELDLIAMRSRIEFVRGTIAVRNHDWDKATKHMTLIVTMCDSKATTLRQYSSEIYVDSVMNEILNIRKPSIKAAPNGPANKQEPTNLLQRCAPRLFSFGNSKPQRQRSLSSSMRVAPAVDASASDSLKQVNYYRTKAVLLIKTIKESKLKQTAMAQEIHRLMNLPLRSQET